MSERSPSGGTRDNKYYLGRLKREAPALLADLESGKIASPAEAFRVAGLKRPRTRLQELKNSWSKASVAEQREFLGWLRATIPSHTPTPVSRSAPATAGVALSDAMKRDILRIMAGRAITSGQVMKEIGFKALNPSLGLALHRGTKIEPKLAAALSKWIFENVD